MSVDSSGTGVVWDGGFEALLRRHLPSVDVQLHETDELGKLGFDSMEVIRLLVDIEAEYSICFPDEVLGAQTFATVGSLWQAVAEVRSGASSR